jgi:hypothetical protein
MKGDRSADNADDDEAGRENKNAKPGNNRPIYFHLSPPLLKKMPSSDAITLSK